MTHRRRREPVPASSMNPRPKAQPALWTQALLLWVLVSDKGNWVSSSPVR